MKRFIFGFDAQRPEACAAELRANGADAVVVAAADRRTEEALAREGLALYLCFGAYAAGPESSGAQDALGRAVRWFGSGCPNDTVNKEARLAAALDRLRKTPGARGLFVDGARFASFASGEGFEVFFTCFCPRCMRRMEERGLDAGRVREAAARLLRTGRIGGDDGEALRGWFSFRAACTRAYFDRFAAAVHTVRPDCEAGAFVFAPSLGGFVGQAPETFAALDLFSPMLYRAYPHPEGPACLGHEWAACLDRFDARTARLLVQTAGVPTDLVPGGAPREILEKGFAPGRIAEELAALRGRPAGGPCLLPILQTEDPLLPETVRAALSAGADGYGLFAYGLGSLTIFP